MGKPVAAAGALALFMSGAASVQVAKAQAPAAQPAAGAQTKNWKDRAEYDLYVKITQTNDPKARLELLNTWQDKYPTTDYSKERSIYFVVTLSALAQSDPTQRQPLITKAQELLKSDPENLRALLAITQFGPAVGGNSPSPDLLSQVDSAAHEALKVVDTTFDASKKPANVSQADWDKAKVGSIALAQNSIAWVAMNKKDNAAAEQAYVASLTANPDQGNISAALARLLYDDKKVPDALFEYARAAQYSGPGLAVPASGRTQLLDFFNRAYKGYHGSADGADKILEQAKTTALPPSGFTIGSAADAANKEMDAIKARLASDPAFSLWYSIRQSLTGDQGEDFFNKSMKGAEVPGGANGVQNFSGTVISIDPPDKPTKVTLGVDDPTKADATLTFTKPLPASALDKIKVGEKLEFSGVAESYTKDPFMLTFEDPAIPGVQTTAPAKKGRKR
jgi:tetratricopeptide (TPR) repeat protein